MIDNSIDKVGSTSAVKNQLLSMINSSGKAVQPNSEVKSADAKVKEQNAQHQDNESKKKLENELMELSKKLNDEMKNIGTDINFSYNENIPGLKVTVKEYNGDKVIREIPSKEAIELMKRMRELVGVIFDKKG